MTQAFCDCKSRSDQFMKPTRTNYRGLSSIKQWVPLMMFEHPD